METALIVEGIRTFLYVAAATLFGYYFLPWLFRWHNKKLPPGPREWGTSWKILKVSWNGTLTDLAFQWAKKYGDMTFVSSFGQPLLFLNSAEITRKLFNSEKFKFLVADRIQMAASGPTKYNGKDLVFSKFDDIMKKKRRLFYKLIGLYGDGVERFENMVWGEMERMFSQIEESEGEDLDVVKVLSRSLKIIIYILAMGERPADPTIPDILEHYDMATNKLLKTDADFILTYLPFVTYLPGKYKDLVGDLKAAKEKADKLIYYSQKRTYVPGRPRGLTDLLMDHQKTPGYEWLENDEEHIIAFLASMFFAAHLTSRALLTGAFLCLLNHPRVTEKIQEEIDRVIGDQRPKIEHKSSMPYTEASILEALRLVAPAPLAGFRRASQDLDFEGMFIPKSTVIFMNIWNYSHDENVWEDPWSYKPERFLDSEGQLLTADHQIRKNLLAFGIGARSCPGEVFSRSRVFIILTSILQRYDILPPANEKLTPANFQFQDESQRGIIGHSLQYSCRLVPRRKIHK